MIQRTTGPGESIRAGSVRRYPASASARKRSAGVRHPSVARRHETDRLFFKEEAESAHVAAQTARSTPGSGHR